MRQVEKKKGKENNSECIKEAAPHSHQIDEL
jgi:hypothetical protein